MSEFIVHQSEQELRESLEDVEAMLEDFRQAQEQIDQQRAVFTDRVQGALAEHGKRVSEYEQQRDDLQRRQQLLIEQRQPFLETRDRLQMQLDSKRGVKRARAAASPGGSGGGKGGDPPSIAPAAAAGKSPDPPRPTTKAQVEQLKSQLSTPKPELKPKPPGGSHNNRLEEELKLIAKIKQKSGRLIDESIEMRSNWNRGSGRKP